MFLQLLVGGIAVGCIYALIGLGYSLIYSASGLMSFVQGEIFMLGAYVAFTIYVGLGIPFLLAVLIAYLVVRRRNHVNNIIDTLSMLPYIIPGSVVGIALVMGFSKGPLVLTGTAAIMVVSMCIRRIPYTIRSSVASASLGASKFKTFWKVTTPMMVNGIMSGAILSWVTLITELSSSIILYSSKTITLNLGVYIMVSRGTDGKACAISTILTVMTIISLVLVTKLSKGREITL